MKKNKIVIIIILIIVVSFTILIDTYGVEVINFKEDTQTLITYNGSDFCYANGNQIDCDDLPSYQLLNSDIETELYWTWEI